MADEVAPIRLEELFKGRHKPLERVVTTKNGTKVKITLTAPHASDAGRASRIVRRLASNSNVEAERISLIILACCSCIDGVDHDNVMEFLGHFEPEPGVIVECLKLLGIRDKILKKLDFDTSSEPATKSEETRKRDGDSSGPTRRLRRIRPQVSRATSNGSGTSHVGKPDKNKDE